MQSWEQSYGFVVFKVTILLININPSRFWQSNVFYQNNEILVVALIWCWDGETFFIQHKLIPSIFTLLSIISVSRYSSAYVLLSESSVDAREVCACCYVCAKEVQVGFGQGGVLQGEVVFVKGINPGGSQWHNAEITEKQIWVWNLTHAFLGKEAKCEIHHYLKNYCKSSRTNRQLFADLSRACYFIFTP